MSDLPKLDDVIRPFNGQWKIKNIRRGNGARQHILYANLLDDKGEIVIASTLDYIVTRIHELTRPK